MLADVASDEVCWDSLVGKITREGIFTVRLEVLSAEVVELLEGWRITNGVGNASTQGGSVTGGLLCNGESGWSWCNAVNEAPADTGARRLPWRLAACACKKRHMASYSDGAGRLAVFGGST